MKKISFRDKDNEESLVNKDSIIPSEQHHLPTEKPPRFDKRKTQLEKDVDLENKEIDLDLNGSFYVPKNEEKRKKKKFASDIDIERVLALYIQNNNR